MRGYFQSDFSPVHARMYAASIRMKKHSEEKRRENVRKRGWNVISAAAASPAAGPPQCRAARNTAHARSVAGSAVNTAAAVRGVQPVALAISPARNAMSGGRNASGMSRDRGAS